MQNRLQRVLFPLYRRLERSALVLRYLFVELTQRCNLACLHCGSDCSARPRADELDTDAWVAFFDGLGARIDKTQVVLVITGGEPLCAPGLPKILDAIARNGFAFGMVSNGWALDQRVLDDLTEHGLHSLTLSLDGLEDTHDWLRGREGSFARVVAAARLVAQARLPFFDVVTCANPRNLDQLPRVQSLLDDLGVPAWRIFSIFPRGRAVANASLRLSDAELHRLLSWIAEARLGDRRPKPAWSCEGYLPPELDRTVRDQPYFCRAGINIGGVLCDGSITACPNISRELVQGNIRTDDLAEVWENRFTAFRDRRWMATGRCADCDDWASCQGNSMHLWDDRSRQTVLCHRDVLCAG
jgi:radical SAM protein with 4Fe4S-binding SPASM domain